MKARQFALLLVLALIWGSAFIMIEVVVDEVHPLTIVAGRILIAALLLPAIALAARQGFPPRSAWPLLFVLAALNNVVPFSLVIWAQQHITSSLAATLNATMPLFTFIIAASVGSEKRDTEKALGVVIGLAGAAIVIGADVRDLTSSNTLAQFAVIGGASAYATAAVLARERLEGEPLVMAGGQMLAGALMAIPLALVIDGIPDLDISTAAKLNWLALGILPTGLAYIIFFHLVQRVSATNVAVVAYLIPVVATVLGVTLRDDPLGPNLFIGLPLILIGMAADNGAITAALKRAT